MLKTSTPHFAPREIVWAKVEPYPWWPGKIVKSITQNSSKVYKISFFCDPTYCYLLSSQIKTFADFDPSLNSSFPSNFKLSRATEMASVAYSKNNALQKQHHLQPEYPKAVKAGLSLGDETFEFMDAEESKKHDFHQNESIAQATLWKDMYTSHYNQQVTAQNVIELLQLLPTSLKNDSYCYSMRKDSVAFKSKLQNQLLKKYNLLDLKEHKVMDSLKVNKNNEQVQRPKSQFLQKKKNIHKIGFKNRHKNHKNPQQIYVAKIMMTRRLYQLLKGRSQSSFELKTLVKRTVERIFCIAQGSQLKWKSLFIATIDQINSTRQLCPPMAEPDCFGEILKSLCKLQSEKNTDDQVSNVTQISSTLG